MARRAVRTASAAGLPRRRIETARLTIDGRENKFDLIRIDGRGVVTVDPVMFPAKSITEEISHRAWEGFRSTSVAPESHTIYPGSGSATQIYQGYRHMPYRSRFPLDNLKEEDDKVETWKPNKLN